MNISTYSLNEYTSRVWACTLVHVHACLFVYDITSGQTGQTGLEDQLVAGWMGGSA